MKNAVIWAKMSCVGRKKGRPSNSRKTGRMEELVDENCVCSEVWWSASKSSLCHELSSCCSGQAFFRTCNFLYNNSGSCGFLWGQVPSFPLVQCKEETGARSGSLWSEGIGLAPCSLDFVQPEFPLCVQHFCAPSVAWGVPVRKKVLRTFKAGWTPLQSIKWMESLCWKCLKKKTQKKMQTKPPALLFVSFVCKALASILGVFCT